MAATQRTIRSVPDARPEERTAERPGPFARLLTGFFTGRLTLMTERKSQAEGRRFGIDYPLLSILFVAALSIGGQAWYYGNSFTALQRDYENLQKRYDADVPEMRRLMEMQRQSGEAERRETDAKLRDHKNYIDALQNQVNRMDGYLRAKGIDTVK